jgi:hypothetical protein
MKLLPPLLADLKAVCAAFPDPRKGRGGNIAMADFGLSAFAVKGGQDRYRIRGRVWRLPGLTVGVVMDRV